MFLVPFIRQKSFLRACTEHSSVALGGGVGSACILFRVFLEKECRSDDVSL